MTWALKRQILFLLVFFIALASFGVWVTYPLFHRPPSCVDNTQNGDELGVDCGGSCSTACGDQLDPISLLWARSFEVVPGRYNAVAYIKNHNEAVAVKKIRYRFRFADKDNLYIGKREGSTFIPPAGNFAIFEPAVDVGNSIPVYTTFEFSEEPVWSQVGKDKANQLKVFATDIQLTDELSNPKLSALITNNSLFAIPEITVVAILYDELGNAVSASRTYVDALQKEQSQKVNFTWPQPFPEKVVVKEIIPMYDVFKAKLK